MQPLACDLWLMERHAFQQFIRVSSSAFRLSEEQAKAISTAAPKRQKSVAIVPVHGVLEARPSFIGEMLGMTSYERVGGVLRMLLADDSVGSIVMDFATPGGMVYGCSELANDIFNSRGRKPIIGVANPMAASGGYWLASACDRLVVTPSGDVGSVGVIAEHVDMSSALEREGAKVTVIRSSQSPYKGEGIDTEPLSEEAKAHMQARADNIYQRFVSDLAKFRGVSVEHVNESFGKGRIVDSRRAMSSNMVDRVDSLQSVVEKLAEGRIRIANNGERSQDMWDGPTPRECRIERVEAVRARIGETA